MLVCAPSNLATDEIFFRVAKLLGEKARSGGPLPAFRANARFRAVGATETVRPDWNAFTDYNYVDREFVLPSDFEQFALIGSTLSFAATVTGELGGDIRRCSSMPWRKE